MKNLTAIIIAACFIAPLLVGCSKQTPTSKNDTDSAETQVIILNQDNFDAQIETGVVLVDFWATWCPPCKIQGPIVEQVATRVQGQAKVAKLDVDSAPDIAQRFAIGNIPTLIVFKDGKSMQKFVGVTDADKLVSAIQAQL